VRVHEELDSAYDRRTFAQPVRTACHAGELRRVPRRN